MAISLVAASRQSPLLNLRVTSRADDVETGRSAEIEPMPCTMDLCKQCCRVSLNLVIKIISIVMGLIALSRSVYDVAHSSNGCNCNCTAE